MKWAQANKSVVSLWKRTVWEVSVMTVTQKKTSKSEIKDQSILEPIHSKPVGYTSSHRGVNMTFPFLFLHLNKAAVFPEPRSAPSQPSQDEVTDTGPTEKGAVDILGGNADSSIFYKYEMSSLVKHSCSNILGLCSLELISRGAPRKHRPLNSPLFCDMKMGKHDHELNQLGRKKTKHEGELSYYLSLWCLRWIKFCCIYCLVLDSPYICESLYKSEQ